MNCPVCSNTMIEEDFGGAHVDVCKNGCMGIWFDWTELAKLDEKHEGFGNALQAALNSDHHKVQDRETINCPKCNMKMIAHSCKEAKRVTIDECYGCGGFFLDAGELEKIREHHATEEEREREVQALIEGISGYNKNKEQLESQKLQINPNASSRATAIGKLFQAINQKF